MEAATRVDTMADAWRDRVHAFLSHAVGHRASTSHLGVAVPRPHGVAATYAGGLVGDGRFRIERGFETMVCLMAPPVVPKRKVERKKKEPPRFVASNTGFAPPQACWDCILPTYRAWVPVLPSWKWVFVLSAVSKAFADALRPLRTEIARIMASVNTRGICKSKANELFALTLAELKPLPFSEVALAGYSRRQPRVMHLLSRSAVLELAFGKHGASFESLNAAFLARRARIKRLREAWSENGGRSQKRRCWDDSSDSDW